MNNNNNNSHSTVDADPEFIDVDKNYFEKLSEYTAVRTHVWGPPTWFFLHSMAMAYPKKLMKIILNILELEIVCFHF